MAGRSIFRFLAVATLTFWAVTIQAFTRAELEYEYQIKVDDQQKSVMLPSGSTVTESEHPLIHITHPSNGQVLRLAGERQRGQYYIRVDGQLYTISNLALVDPGPGPVVYGVPQPQAELVESLRQEKEQIQKQLESLLSQLKLSNNNNKVLEEKLKAEQLKKSQLEKKVEDNKSITDKLQQSLNDKARAYKQEREKFELDKRYFQQRLEQAYSEASKAKNELENERTKQKEAEAWFEKEKTKLEHQHKQQQKQQNKLQEELERTRNQASKDAEGLKKQHRSELRSKEASHKKEVSELANSRQQLNQNNQKLKEDLKQAQAKVPTSEKSTQCDENDWLAKPDEMDTLNSEESSFTPGHENDSNPSSVKGDEVSKEKTHGASPNNGRKEKKGKKKKKKNNKTEESSKAGEPYFDRSSKEQTPELPEPYNTVITLLATSFQELSEAGREKKQSYKKGKSSSKIDIKIQENYEEAVEVAMGAVLDAIPDEYDMTGRAARELVCLLTDQFHYFKKKKDAKQVKKIVSQIHQVIIRYRELFAVFTPLSELNRAFDETKHPVTIEQDFLALALIQVVHKQKIEIFEALLLLNPESIKDAEDLEAVLQALLYGLIASEIDYIENILAKLITAPLETLFSDCCYIEGSDSDSDDSLNLEAGVNADSARRIFSLIIYIKRMTDFQLQRITRRIIWSDIDPGRIRTILHNLQTLLDHATQSSNDFEEGDAKYVEKHLCDEKHLYDEFPKIIHPDEFNHYQNWLGIFDKAITFSAETKFYSESVKGNDNPPGYEEPAKPWELAMAGVLQQLCCLQQPLVIPEHLTFDPEGRLARMGMKIEPSNAQPSLFDIARLARRNKENMIQFLQKLLWYIVRESVYSQYFLEMQKASCPKGKKPNLNNFLTMLITNASSTGTAVAPQWGEPTVFQLIARFLKRPVMLIMMTGYTDNVQTIALFFRSGHMEMNYTTVDEVIAILQEHQNVLIIGFIAHPPQAGAATTAPGGYWLEMTFDAQAAVQAGTVVAENREYDKKPGDNSTNNDPPSQSPFPHSGLVVPAHLLPGIMGDENNQVASTLIQ